ncbi:MAG: 2-C-methyl-D-erythritol 4-phosphate cytidylyltransferase [Firmicutes bacterium]|nr:2-C-methyl-D-erythritol 4-phosphate cytidylyltransferase [Bacillota bacterium]
MGVSLNKVYLPLGDRPLLLHSCMLFEEAPAVACYVVVVHPGEHSFCRALLAPYRLKKLAGVVAGGETRQDSVAAGLRELPEDCTLAAVHDAARPLLAPEVLEGAVQRARESGAVVVGVPVKDTIKIVGAERQIRATPAREELWIAQTPQIFRRALLERAHAEAEREGFTGTDDASLVERLGEPVEVYPGSYENIKITTPEDLLLAEAIWERRQKKDERKEAGGPPVRVGMGCDVHPFAEGRPLVLGGVEIPGAPGLAGHSDADVVLHAVMDACLGAAGLPDIGSHFPPSDPCWRGAPSLALLAHVRSLLAGAGFAVSQVDVVVAAQAPRLAAYLDLMKERIGLVLGVPPGAVGIKATTTEGLGFVGRKEGIAAWAVATLVPKRVNRKTIAGEVLKQFLSKKGPEDEVLLDPVLRRT